MDGTRLEQVSGIKYLGHVSECWRKMASRRKVVGFIKSLINARSLQLECARIIHEGLLVPVLLHGNETMIWREKERSRISPVQMGNLRCLLGIRRMERLSNVRIRELCGVVKWGGRKDLRKCSLIV